MIRPAEIQKKANKERVRDTQIEKDYILTWILTGVAANEVLSKALPEDFFMFGMIPELMGRLPIFAPLTTLTEEQLTIGSDAIPLDTVKMVHCWTNRSALGTADGRLTVNIETSGKNRVLRSLRAGEEAAESERRLRELVTALGYGARLPEQ